MLRFAVFDENGPAARWPVVNAHLLGPDDMPAPGQVEFEDGLIVCRRRVGRAMALAIQHDAGPFGTLMLQTCLLPERSEPYVLSVELARHRIKMFIAKSEEWQMFDLSEGHPAMRHWNEARVLLTRALTAATAVESDHLARESLHKAMEASERLAMAHAEILLHRRFGSRAASSATLGVRVSPARDGRSLRDLIAANFDLLVLPLTWKELEVEEGKYRWEPIDRWMEWAKSEGKPIVAGPLLDFSRRALPEWMYVWQHDYDTCRDLAYDHMERVVERYKSVVGMWNIASGINVNENFEFTEPQMIDLVRTASLLVRQARKGARTMIELREPFGAHGATRKSSLPPLSFVDRLVQEGSRFDAVGVQVLMGQADKGRATRDLMQLSSFLDRFFLLELPVLISAAGVPSEPVDPQGGDWHGPWTPETQARWVGRFFSLAMSKPFVESFFWSDLYDHEGSDLPGAGLISSDGKPKPALARLVGMRRRLKKPLGQLKLPTRAPTT